MKILRNLIIFFCLIVTSKMLNAQDGVVPIPYQYGNIPVNLSTGAPNVNIPFWTASSGSLSVPISANYSTNGLRSSDTPSELGLHWTLSLGGSIVQIVRSNNDLGTIQDKEPDIFKVNAPGISVDFMIDENNNFIKLSESDINISYIGTNNEKFLIISSDGTKYFFEKQTYYLFANMNEDGTISIFSESRTWLLTKIEDVNNIHTITFNYSKPNDDIYTICYGENYTGTNIYNGESSESKLVTFITEQRLDSIETENETIVFNYFTPSEYSSPYPKQKKEYVKELGVKYWNRIEEFLENIEIKTKNSELIKKYDFNYYVNNYNRVFLHSITEKDKNGISLPSYNFEYYDVDNTGVVFNNKSDFWGYYNPGASGSFIYKMFPVNEVPIGMLKKYFIHKKLIRSIFMNQIHIVQILMRVLPGIAKCGRILFLKMVLVTSICLITLKEEVLELAKLRVKQTIQKFQKYLIIQKNLVGKQKLSHQADYLHTQTINEIINIIIFIMMGMILLKQM